MYLKDIKIIDKTRSTLDKEASQPEKGLLVFKKKTYWKPKGDDGSISQHMLHWVRKSDTGFEIEEALDEGYDFVTMDSRYYPTTRRLDEEKHFRFKDTRLMMIDMTLHLEKLVENAKAADRSTKGRMAEFQALAARDGVAVEEEILKQMFKSSTADI